MSRKRKYKLVRKYSNKQLTKLAHKLGLPGNVPKKDIAIKLAEYLSIKISSHTGYMNVLDDYFSNPVEIVGIVPFIPKPTDSNNRQLQKPNVVTDDFLKSYQWRKLRLVALELHGKKCLCCGASPATGAVMHVDHIKPRRLYPELSLDINNLQVLCEECNHGKGNWCETDFRTNKDAN